MLIQLNGGWTSWAVAHRSDMAEMSEMDLNMVGVVVVGERGAVGVRIFAGEEKVFLFTTVVLLNCE